jgi:hypothetical protein
MQGPEFKPQYHQKKKEEEEERKIQTPIDQMHGSLLWSMMPRVGRPLC